MNAIETFHLHTDNKNRSQLKDKTPFKIKLYLMQSYLKTYTNDVRTDHR